jgi:hypothetical protein
VLYHLSYSTYFYFLIGPVALEQEQGKNMVSIERDELMEAKWKGIVEVD